MSKESKIFLIVMVAVVVVAGGLIFAFSRNKIALNTGSGKVAGANTEEASSKYSNEYIEKLAKFLTSKGAVFYGAYWCSHCKQQKELFGDAIKYIDYVECDARGSNANPDECRALNIQSYPTWVYQGKLYPGVKSFAELASLVGFSQ